MEKLKQQLPAINIGAEGQRQRLTFGLIALVVGDIIAAGLIFGGANRWWRLLLFLPYALAGIGIFQAREKT